MSNIFVFVGLGAVALVLFAAERCISLFTWSRLEGLTTVPRSRRQAVEDCLEERELVAMSFSVTGSTVLVVLALLFGVLRIEEFSPWHLVAAAGVVLLIVWLLPEIASWTVRDRVVLYLVPVLYRVIGFPFRKLRRMAGLSLRPTSENGRREGEAADDIINSDADAEAHDLFREAVRLQHSPVREIMTPRTDMVSVAITGTLSDAARTCVESGKTRLPVFRGNRDDIVGVIHVKDLLAHAASEAWDRPELEQVMMTPVFVPETKTISELLEEFQRSNTHIGIVLDEYGGTSGLVTLEDMLEELIGEIHDEHEDISKETPLYTLVNDEKAEVQSVMRVEEFNEEFDFDLPDQEDFDTIGGFVTFILGKIPATGETFHYSQARFTVVEADPRHVIRVLVAFDEAPHLKEKA